MPAGYSWKMDASTLGVTFLTMGDAAAFWSANNPSVMTVRAFRRKQGAEAEETKRDIRLGGFAGSMLALMVGIGGTMVTRSYWPVTGSVFMLVFQWSLWEWAMANPHGSALESIATQTDGQSKPQGNYGLVK